MGRSNGYRPTKATEKQVMYLRAKLGKVRASEWQKASCIMQEITGLLGHRGGPGNSMIQPRACTACGFYGHTKQWCKVRLANEMSAADEDKLYRQRMGIAVCAGRPASRTSLGVRGMRGRGGATMRRVLRGEAARRRVGSVRAA